MSEKPIEHWLDEIMNCSLEPDKVQILVDHAKKAQREQVAEIERLKAERNPFHSEDMCEVCEKCERAYSFIYRLPDSVWKRISASHTLLCPACADLLCKQAGIQIFWEGSVGSKYPMDHFRKQITEAYERCETKRKTDLQNWLNDAQTDEEAAILEVAINMPSHDLRSLIPTEEKTDE